MNLFSKMSSRNSQRTLKLESIQEVSENIILCHLELINVILFPMDMI